MTQSEIKTLASEIIGDGQLPNKFFVTTSPFVINVGEDGDREFEELEGYNQDDSVTVVFDSYKEASDYFDTIELDVSNGVSSVSIEDRLYGILKEHILEKVIKVDYVLSIYLDFNLPEYEK
jgi:hypothetical protein